MKKKKGQFFILSAVLVTLALFALNSVMNQNWQFDVSSVQAEDSAVLIKNIENELNKKTYPWDASNELDYQILTLEKMMKRKNYDIEIKYEFNKANATEIPAKIKISSVDFSIERQIILRPVYYDVCQNSETADQCASLAQEEKCCSYFSLCC